MTDIEGFLTIYGHSDNLLNNNMQYYAVKSKSVGIYTCICTRQPSEVSLRCVRKCVSLLTVHVMLAQTVNKYSLAIRRSRSDMIADVFLPHGWN